MMVNDGIRVELRVIDNGEQLVFNGATFSEQRWIILVSPNANRQLPELWLW